MLAKQRQPSVKNNALYPNERVMLTKKPSIERGANAF